MEGWLSGLVCSLLAGAGVGFEAQANRKALSDTGQRVYDLEQWLMIHTRDLVKGYHGQEVTTPVLINVNIDVGDGEFVAIAGPSGSGKSTLFNILGLLEAPDAGSIVFRGEEVAGLGEADRLALRRGHIAYVFRQFNLVDERLGMQIVDASDFRDVVNTYFHRMSGIGDAKGRNIYP